jgi:hypothetical protein
MVMVMEGAVAVVIVMAIIMVVAIVNIRRHYCENL